MGQRYKVPAAGSENKALYPARNYESGTPAKRGILLIDQLGVIDGR